jgi:hypothetical protein
LVAGIAPVNSGRLEMNKLVTRGPYNSAPLKDIGKYVLTASVPLAAINPIAGGTVAIAGGALYVVAGWIDTKGADDYGGKTA